MAREPEPPALVDGHLSIAVLEYWLGVFDEVKLADDQTHYCIPEFIAFLKLNSRAVPERHSREQAGKPAKKGQLLALAG